MTLTGIIPPVPTPFNQTGELDLSALSSLLESLEPEVDGMLVLGSNGEAAYVSGAERLEIIKTARASVPRDKPLLVGTGGEATQRVIERNQAAADLGADFVLVIAPFYFRGAMKEDVLRKHYETLAGASPVPVLLYNIPQVTGFSLSPGLIAKLSEHPNIVGMKDSSGAIGPLTEIMRQVPEGFTVLTGNAPTLLPALSLGAQGGILAVANVAATAYKRIIESFQAGDMVKARDLQTRLNPLALAVTSQYGVPGLKAALRQQGRAAGYPRAPLQDVAEDVVQELKGLLELIL